MCDASGARNYVISPESESIYLFPEQYTARAPYPWHNGTMNAVFVDGHVIRDRVYVLFTPRYFINPGR